MKKIIIMLLLLFPVVCGAQQFSIAPMLMQEKNIETDQQKQLMAWESSVMFFQQEVFGKYTVRWWEEKIRIQEVRLGYSFQNLKPFASIDIYDGKSRMGGGMTVLLRNANTYIGLTGKGYESGYGFNGSIGFMNQMNIVTIEYEMNKYGETVFSGPKVNFGFLF